MNPITILLYVGLVISSAVILFQDFKERQVSLWVLLLFGAITLSSVIYFRDAHTLLYNGIGVMLYGAFIWLILKLYFFAKTKQHKVLLNHQLGMADVLVFLFIGSTFNIVGMILFFCGGFIFSLVSFILYVSLKKGADSQRIPLAGFLVFFYVISIIILNLVSLNHMIDCSFIRI